MISKELIRLVKIEIKNELVNLFDRIEKISDELIFLKDKINDVVDAVDNVMIECINEDLKNVKSENFINEGGLLNVK